MCLPTVVVELGFVAVVICTFYDFIFLDHFSLILNSIVFLMVASNFVFYAASVSVASLCRWIVRCRVWSKSIFFYFIAHTLP